MSIIDFHTHVFPDELAPRAVAKLIENAMATGVSMKNHTNATINGLEESMRKNGINASVTLAIATKPAQVSPINMACAESIRQNIIPFGSLHPDMENFEAEIDFLVNHKIKGIKLHPEYQYFYVDDKRLYPMYEKLSSSGLIVVFHTGKDPGPFTCDHALAPAIRQIHLDFPKLKIVGAHMGGWMLWDEAEETLAGLDIFLDTSAIYYLMAKEDFARLCRKHGCEKIVFGSDSPWYDQGECVKWIMETSLTDHEKEIILRTNATRLLDL
ncbi:MAG: amidohydrolase family protein [Chitinispirillales bacterium]|jgi:predicted TIM-barrel fold metal-dependent hydrolase|nr:amidohydrolase family protein [Chitinispirillales bacterium]